MALSLLSLQEGWEGSQHFFRKLRAFWWRPLVDGWKAWLTPLNLGPFVSCLLYVLCYPVALSLLNLLLLSEA